MRPIQLRTKPDVVQIVRRVNQSLPEHFSADLSQYEIVRHNVGIRPYRSSGMRIEKEVKDGQNIVHAYGKSSVMMMLSALSMANKA